MQREPIEVNAMSAVRKTRRAVSSTRPSEGAVEPSGEMTEAVVRDEAFAGFSRVDAGTAPCGVAADRQRPANWRTATRELISDIAAQLEALESQRRQLARLLESVEQR
jgi:hypothetical protein